MHLRVETTIIVEDLRAALEQLEEAGADIKGKPISERHVGQQF